MNRRILLHKIDNKGCHSRAGGNLSGKLMLFAKWTSYNSPIIPFSIFKAAKSKPAPANQILTVGNDNSRQRGDDMHTVIQL